MAGESGSAEEQYNSSQLVRNAANYFEKFERYDCQELLAYTFSHWMLSTDDFKVPTEPAAGLISHMKMINGNTFHILMPEEEGIPPLDFREVHQIVRELTYGIYVLNQIPNIALEANYDQSTTCQLPLAYQDTRVGQILINIDYMMKALWHGAYFPKEKRTKFSERWRSNLDVNSSGKPETKKPLLTEFTSAGMLDVSKDPDFSQIYDKLPVEQPGDAEMAEERRFFMSHVDDLSMQMTVFQNAVQQNKNLFVVDSDWLISSVVRLAEDRIDCMGYERLNARLQLHEIMLRENLTNKNEIHRQLHLLKLMSFLVPFLIGMKKRMKIPNLNRLLPEMTGDETKTERELPPLILSPDFRCKNFSFGSHYFHLHGGIQIDHETPEPDDPSRSMIEAFESIHQEALLVNKKLLDPDAPLQETYPIPIKEFDGVRYYSLAFEFETYYPQAPQKPRWLHAMGEEVRKLRPKRLPMTDIQLHEQFKKYFSYKKAIKYKNPPQGLKAAAIRGLCAIFQTLCRKVPGSRLGKQDEAGFSLIHHAAMNNRPNIIATLILQSMDVNVRRNNNIQSTGPTPLHLAARCGALDAVACLTANYANVLVTDQDGWAPIHHAAFFDHVPVIKLLVHKHEALLELQTKNELKSTPLLLAASSGALSAVKTLINLGAYVLRKDDHGNNVIHLAALRFHTNVLEFFIQWDRPEVPVWKLLVGMLLDKDVKKKDSAVKCLEVMSTSDPEHWKSILDAGGVAALVDLLKIDDEELQSVAASVLHNISEHEPIKHALTKANAAPILIQLLGSPVDDIQSRAAIVLADLASVDNNQIAIADQGGIAPLVNLLDSEEEEVLVNAVNAVRVMCTSNRDNQTAVAQHQGIEPLVEFLTVNSDILQATSAAAIAALTEGHRENQDAVVAEGAVKPLVNLIKGRNVSVQVKAAGALEALSEKNPQSQAAFLDLDAPIALIRLLKIWSMEVKEQGACALWALAGHTNTQQKFIAQRIGIHSLIEMLMLASEKLQYVGCMAMTALSREDMDHQNRIAEESGIQPLIRLLRSNKTSERVLLAAIKVVGVLCLGVAHRNNKVTQKRIAEENAIQILVQLLLKPPSVEIQVEVAATLGCVVLGNHDNQEKLKEEAGFKFDLLLDLLSSPDQNIRLKAGFALSIFAFNNTHQQYSIREAGGIQYRCFEVFLESPDEHQQCQAAFQTVVLARVIVDMDQVSLTARGVTMLVQVLDSEEDNAIILAASLMSSLAHTRAGIPDAMVTCGAINKLIERLHSTNDQVRSKCAVALGYLSFNRTAARQLLMSCRNSPGLYERLMRNIGRNPKISPEFTEDFIHAKQVGLPCLSLEVNGGPPAVPPSRRDGRRPHTTQSFHAQRQKIDFQMGRTTSAPAFGQRARSAGPVRLKPIHDEKRGETVKDTRFQPRRDRVGTAGSKIDSTGFKSRLSAWAAKK